MRLLPQSRTMPGFAKSTVWTSQRRAKALFSARKQRRLSSEAWRSRERRLLIYYWDEKGSVSDHYMADTACMHDTLTFQQTSLVLANGAEKSWTGARRVYLLRLNSSLLIKPLEATMSLHPCDNEILDYKLPAERASHRSCAMDKFLHASSQTWHCGFASRLQPAEPRSDAYSPY